MKAEYRAIVKNFCCVLEYLDYMIKNFDWLDNIFPVMRIYNSR